MTGDFKEKIENDPQVNRYDRLNYKYNYFNPGVTIEYNVDDGLFVGVQGKYVKQGFRKEPYSMQHFFRATRAFATGSLHFRYEADFIKVFRHTDLLIRTDFRGPTNVTNFFGIGNETVFDESKGGIQYYRIRYDVVDASVYFRRQLQSWMRFNIGPTFQFFSLDSQENKGHYVTDEFLPTDYSKFYSAKSFAGADVRLDINSKNNQAIPTRGLMLDMGVRSLLGLNDRSADVIQANVDMRIFMSLAAKTRLVLATRFGWGANYGDYEIPQAMYLSGTDNLRGYRKQRFAGKSMFFNNTELRVRLFDFNTYLFPGSFGLFLFNDVGRVWVKEEDSNDWHVGNGGGIWIAPIKRFVVTGAIGRSKEEKMLPRVTFGFSF